jgi:hypothetical protein
VADGNGGVVGLTNMAQELVGTPEEDWRPLVEGRLHMLRSASPEVPADYGQAGPRLRIRLSADGSQPGYSSYRPVCDGLDQLLMLRNEVGSITVNDEQILRWGVDPYQVWKDALDHTIWDEPRERRILARGDVRLVWVRANFFASSALLQLDHLLSPHNRFGALVMAPVRDALLYTEVNDPGVVLAAASLIEVGGGWFVDGPGSISPDLFWYQPKGRISRAVRLEEGRFQPCWGSEFSAVLAELSVPGRPRKRPRKK